MSNTRIPEPRVPGFQDSVSVNGTINTLGKIQLDGCRLPASVRQFVGKATATIQALPLASQEGYEWEIQYCGTAANLSWLLSLDKKLLSSLIALTVPSVTPESDASISRAGVQY